MIRNPSDGTVYEKPKLSGLPELKKDNDERIRLEKSRDWLERWKKDLDKLTLALSDEQKHSG